ncbi:MAG: sugar phosphate nucleotidyltransferase [Actinomycetota bacterium]|nr:sugar phosphate nucleotidyltransferase [Actinomycetota bacterium]
MPAGDPVKAFVLAGGRGTRLAPYTMLFPKPLIPLGDLPILEIVLRQLRWYGFNEAIISVGHLASLIEAYFMTRGPIEGLDITYVRETKPLGTAGALGLLGNVDDDLLVVNGDVLTTLDYSTVVTHHRKQDASLTISVHSVELQIELGVLEIDSEGEVVGYVEKPVTRHDCSMGVYVCSPSAIQAIQAGEQLDFPDLVLRLIERGEKVSAYRTDCYWVDIGREEQYRRACEEFLVRRPSLLPDEQISRLTRAKGGSGDLPVG